MKGSTLWKVQRLSALIMLATITYVTFFVVVHTPLNFAVWSGFIKQLHMQILITISLVSMSKHAWVGIQTVLTDYVKCSRIRHALYGTIILMLVLTILTTIFILWRP